MLNFLKNLSTEADIKLTDKRNMIADSLMGKQYCIDQYEIEFQRKEDCFPDGMLSIRNKERPVITTFFNVYIFRDTIFIAVYTLDLVKIVDAPSETFMDVLNNLILQ